MPEIIHGAHTIEGQTHSEVVFSDVYVDVGDVGGGQFGGCPNEDEVLGTFLSQVVPDGDVIEDVVHGFFAGHRGSP